VRPCLAILRLVIRWVMAASLAGSLVKDEIMVNWGLMMRDVARVRPRYGETYWIRRI
jgi:hypothetical protein